MQKIVAKCENSEEILLQKIAESLKKPKFGHGTGHDVYEFSGMNNVLLRVPYGATVDKLEIGANPELHSLSKNPNHMVAMMGRIDFVSKVQGIDAKHKDFATQLARLPQKSFDDFLAHIENLRTQGFSHDFIGDNTLVDKHSKRISTIDSWEQREYKLPGFCPLYILHQSLAKPTNPINRSCEAAIITKKILTSIAKNLSTPFDADFLRSFLSGFKTSNKNELLAEMKELNHLKQELQMKGVEISGDTPLIKDARKKLEQVKEVLQRTEITRD